MHLTGIIGYLGFKYMAVALQFLKRINAVMRERNFAPIYILQSNNMHEQIVSTPRIILYMYFFTGLKRSSESARITFVEIITSAEVEHQFVALSRGVTRRNHD